MTDKEASEKGGLFLHEGDSGRSLQHSLSAIIKLLGTLLVFLLTSFLLVLFSVVIMHLTLGPMAIGINSEAAQARWVYVILMCQSVPVSFLLLLFWGRGYAKQIFGNWLPFLKWRFEKDKEAVVAGITPHLKKNEKIVAHVHCEELFKCTPMWFSLFYVVLFLLLLFVFAFVGGFWSAVEVFNLAILMPALYFFLLVLVWFSDLSKTLDRLSSFFIQISLAALTAGIAKHIWQVMHFRLVVIFVLVAQFLMVLWKFLQFRPSEFIILTNSRMLHAKTVISLSPSPCYKPVDPETAKKNIEWTNSQFGQRWRLQTENGHIDCYPMFASVNSLVALAKKVGLKIKAKKSKQENAQRIGRAAICSFLLWVLFFNLLAAPMLHYGSTLSNLTKDSLMTEKIKAMQVMAKHHPTAIGPRVRLAQYYLDLKEREKALTTLNEAAQIMIFVPHSLRKRDKQCQEAERIFSKLIGPKSEGKTPKSGTK